MVVKHNFSLLANASNPLWGAMLEVNEATGKSLGIGILILIFVVASFVVIRRTQDTGKGLASALHVTAVLALLLYYAGRVDGFVFISDVVMLGLVVAEIFAIGGLYYFRTNKD